MRRRIMAVLSAAIMAIGGTLLTAQPAQAVDGVKGVWNANNNSYWLSLIHIWPGPTNKNWDAQIGGWGVSTYWWSTTGGIYLPAGECARRYVGPYQASGNDADWTRAGADFVGPGRFRLSGNYWVKIVPYNC